MNKYTSNCNLNSAEAALKRIIKYWIVELMDSGGTTSEATCEVIAEEEPDLYAMVGHERAFALCKELHHSEDPAKSEWYGVRFHQFNKQYFGGRLSDYRVRVVYDIGSWTGEPNANGLLSHIDLARREIILAFTQNESWNSMERALIHQMAHAATGTSTEHDDRWLREIQRLRDAGAPVETCQEWSTFAC